MPIYIQYIIPIHYYIPYIQPYMRIEYRQSYTVSGVMDVFRQDICHGEDCWIVVTPPTHRREDYLSEFSITTTPTHRRKDYSVSCRSQPNRHIVGSTDSLSQSDHKRTAYRREDWLSELSITTPPTHCREYWLIELSITNPPTYRREDWLGELSITTPQTHCRKKWLSQLSVTTSPTHRREI